MPKNQKQQQKLLKKIWRCNSKFECLNYLDMVAVQNQKENKFGLMQNFNDPNGTRKFPK